MTDFFLLLTLQEILLYSVFLLPECTSPQSTSRHSIKVRCHSDVGVTSADSSDLQLSVSLPVNTPAESLDSSTGSRLRDTGAG